MYVFDALSLTLPAGAVEVKQIMALKQWPYEKMKVEFSSTFYLSLSFIVSVLLLFKLARRTKPKPKTKLNLPPSPPKLPIIGNLHQLGTLPYRSFRDLSLKYGDMMMLQLGQRQTPTLVVSSAEVAMEIMKTHDLTFSNRPQNTAAKILLYGCNDIGFAVYGEKWRQKRKICVLELLSTKRVQSFRVIREEEAAELVNKLREASSSDASYVNLSEMIMSTSNNIICKCAFGRNFTTKDGYNSVKELARDTMIYLMAFTVRDFFPWLCWVDVLTGKIQKYKATAAAMDALFDHEIAEHLSVKRKLCEHSKRKDLVDILLQLQEDSMLKFDLTNNDLKALITFAARRTKPKTNLNLPPSPPKLPIIGNLHQLGALPHRSLGDLSLKYGDMMMLQLGLRQTPTLVVSSAEVAMEIMKTHDKAFSNRPHSTAGKILLYGCIDVGFGHYGENWRQKKKICIFQLLSMKMVQSFGRIRVEEAAELVNKLREEATLSSSTSDASYVNLSDMLMSTSINIVYKCVFGRKYINSGNSNCNLKESVMNVMAHMTAFTFSDYFPLLGWVDVLTGKIGAFKATSEAFDAVFDQVIEEHLTAKTKTHSEKKDFVDILLQLQQDSMLNFELTKNDVKALLLDMFVGATETTAVALIWAISELVRNPIIMKKAQEEVRNVIEHKSNVEENDINQMHYLKCVVKETLRLHPPATLLAPRETISSVKLNGYDIPAKTMVYINAWAIQRDPKYWNNPEEFLPERFESNQVDFIGKDFQFIPFGFGRRVCPGINFGLASVEYVLANLLCWFDWELPKTDIAHKQDLDMSETFGLVVAKKVPLNLKPMIFSF